MNVRNYSNPRLCHLCLGIRSNIENHLCPAFLRFSAGCSERASCERARLLVCRASPLPLACGDIRLASSNETLGLPSRFARSVKLENGGSFVDVELERFGVTIPTLEPACLGLDPSAKRTSLRMWLRGSDCARRRMPPPVPTERGRDGSRTRPTILGYS